MDSVPPPKLELARFLDGGNGLDVLFDSPTNMIDGEWDVDCATLFDNAQQIGADGTCAWTNSSALRVTFGAGAQIVPFDYVAATEKNAAYLKGGVLKNDLDGATLTSAAQYAEAQKPLHPVAPAISITAPESVGVCDGVVLDARRHGWRVTRFDLQLGRADELGRRDGRRHGQRGGARGQASRLPTPPAP